MSLVLGFLSSMKLSTQLKRQIDYPRGSVAIDFPKLPLLEQYPTHDLGSIPFCKELRLQVLDQTIINELIADETIDAVIEKVKKSG